MVDGSGYSARRTAAGQRLMALTPIAVLTSVITVRGWPRTGGSKEERMKKALMGLAVLPLFAGVAVAAQPLTDRQMDKVAGGFFGQGLAEAEGIVGESGIVVTTTATLGQVFNVATATMGEATSRLWKSI